ncbi:MAG: VPLPA-CTERM sorting domain-containing protein [Nitrospirae bacterium]|nr:VPLPA-CTERM sorting domain-containing protein [Nitrospirota bacterium]
MKQASVKKKMTVLTGAALMLVAGMGQSAEAFNFQQGDLILAIYGNRTPTEGTEAIINLTDLTAPGSGPSMNVLSSTPATTYQFDLSAYLSAAGIIDNNPATPDYPLRYTVMGYQADGSTGGFSSLGGTSLSNQVGTVHGSVGSFAVGMQNWSGAATDANMPNLTPPGQNGSVIAFDNPNSASARTFTTERLFNSFNVVMAGNLDQLLYLVQGDSELIDDPLLGKGQALLTANGNFQITGGELAPVPVPAAAVLFGTGLIGLVGIARRKLFGQAA